MLVFHLSIYEAANGIRCRLNPYQIIFIKYTDVNHSKPPNNMWKSNYTTHQEEDGDPKVVRKHAGGGTLNCYALLMAKMMSTTS